MTSARLRLLACEGSDCAPAQEATVGDRLLLVRPQRERHQPNRRSWERDRGYVRCPEPQHRPVGDARNWFRGHDFGEPDLRRSRAHDQERGHPSTT